MEKINVIQVGLGPIGNRITRFIAEKKQLRLAGGIDIDPAKAGQDLGTLAGMDNPLGAVVTADSTALLSRMEGGVAVLTTSSGLAAIRQTVLDLIAHGLSVVSTCEELSYPWLTNPILAGELDAAARERGVCILGTGINPGFLMDFLPLALTAVCRQVDSIRIERIQDASLRRMPFIQKIGAGLDPEQFEAKKNEGTLRHVGLSESMHMIADRIGWDIEKTEETIEAVTAERKVVTPAITVEAGLALGVLQTGRAFVQGREALTLVFRACIGEPEPRDRIVIAGEPPVDMTIAGGINGDTGTCAITVNAIRAVTSARPGLRTMADLPPVFCSSHNSR